MKIAEKVTLPIKDIKPMAVRKGRRGDEEVGSSAAIEEGVIADTRQCSGAAGKQKATTKLAKTTTTTKKAVSEKGV